MNEVNTQNQNQTETLIEEVTNSVEVSKESLITEITRLMTEEGYTRMPKGKKYKGEGMSIYEWVATKYPGITKREVGDWFKLPELAKVRTKTESVNKVILV